MGDLFAEVVCLVNAVGHFAGAVVRNLLKLLITLLQFDILVF